MDAHCPQHTLLHGLPHAADDRVRLLRLAFLEHQQHASSWRTLCPADTRVSFSSPHASSLRSPRRTQVFFCQILYLQLLSCRDYRLTVHFYSVHTKLLTSQVDLPFLAPRPRIYIVRYHHIDSAPFHFLAFYPNSSTIPVRSFLKTPSWSTTHQPCPPLLAPLPQTLQPTLLTATYALPPNHHRPVASPNQSPTPSPAVQPKTASSKPP